MPHSGQGQIKDRAADRGTSERGRHWDRGRPARSSLAEVTGAAGTAAVPVTYFKVSRYAIRSSRCAADGIPANIILLLGTTAAGDLM